MDNKISVVIPAYNAQEYIGDALVSVLEQTYAVFEVIVVDDGSTDRTKKEIEEFQDKHKHGFFNPQTEIHYIYQDNKGPAAARNTGIQHARGNYIAFLDSDDLWYPQKLERQMALIGQSSYVMVYCDMTHVENGEEVYRSYLHEVPYKYFERGNIYENLLKENFIFTPTVLVKKEVLLECQLFDEELMICEDYKMWLSIAKKYRIGFVDEPLVTRRRTEMNITQDRLLYIQSGLSLFEELMQYPRHSKKNKQIVHERLQQYYYELGYYFWEQEMPREARKEFAKIDRNSPLRSKAGYYTSFSFLPLGLIRLLRRWKACQK